MKRRLTWLLLAAIFLALNALLAARMGDQKAGAIQASAIGFGFR